MRARRKKFILAVLLLLSAISATLGVLLYLLKQEPDYYTQEMSIAPGPEDQVLALNMLSRANNLQDSIFGSPEWGETFTAEEFNAVLRENLAKRNDLTSNAFGKLRHPRIAIVDDRLKIGFRVGEDFWSTVVTLELKLWLVKDELNTIALEVLNFQAGVLPLNKQWPLEYISEAARTQFAEVNWYRHKGNPVGICRLFVNRQGDTQLTGLKVADGRLAVSGKFTGNFPR